MADRSRIDNVAIASRQYNSTLNDVGSAMSSGNRTTLETNLSDPTNGVVAKVIYATGNYVKIKFFYNNKPLGVFKSRDFVEAEALAFRDELYDTYDIWSTLGASNYDSIDATIADNTLTVSQTSQITVNALDAAEDPVDVTASSTYATSDATKATVNAAGLVTGVAAGSATITATYRTFTDTVSVTVS